MNDLTVRNLLSIFHKKNLHEKTDRIKRKQNCQFLFCLF